MKKPEAVEGASGDSQANQKLPCNEILSSTKTAAKLCKKSLGPNEGGSYCPASRKYCAL
jgi:hypothetical protein